MRIAKAGWSFAPIFLLLTALSYAQQPAGELPASARPAQPTGSGSEGAAVAGDKAAQSEPASGAGGTVRENGDRSAAAERPASQLSGSSAFNQAVDRMLAQETKHLANLRQYQPIVETYIQEMKSDPELGAVPAQDDYFIGMLELTAEGASDRSFLSRPGGFRRVWKRMTSIFSLEFLPLGFAQMVLIDNSGFDRQHYDFKFLRREFLGDLRCIVIDVTPKKGTGMGRFLGRVWVEDQDFNIVRFNGTYSGSPHWSRFLHFDTWRLNLRPGVWLPAYVYSEESDLKYRFGSGHVRYKAITRLWGYDPKRSNRQSEMSQVVVDAAEIRDQSDASRNLTPVESNRAWERQAEENALDRLERAGLLAPAGDVDHVLETVVNNLEITNNLNVQPEIRCRLLLTTPMESFAVGHTIVLSRGLVDVLPDEASLAAVLAHELAHIVLGHRLDTKWAFSDRMLFHDEETYRRMNFHHNASEEEAADAKALEILRRSPYKDKLDNVGLFVRALDLHRRQLPGLIRAHLGNGLLIDQNRARMEALAGGAPQLRMKDVAQLPALPMGSRLKVDPWSDRIELVKTKPVPLLSASEKLMFEVTPVFPYVARYGTTPGTATATTAADGRTK